MRSGRVEAFSDGVIAILITIMVLELHVPRHGSLAALRPLLPLWLTYVLSFTMLGIYWNNHHHMLQLTDLSERSKRRQANRWTASDGAGGTRCGAGWNTMC